MAQSLARFRAVLIDLQAVNVEHVQREMLCSGCLFVPAVQSACACGQMPMGLCVLDYF